MKYAVCCQGSEHQAEMAEMEKAYEEVLCVRVKEVVSV